MRVRFDLAFALPNIPSSQNAWHTSDEEIEHLLGFLTGKRPSSR